MTAPSEIVVRPEPTDHELAAILAAYDQLWPTPAHDGPAASPVWRYAGRPWRKRLAYGGWR